MFGLLFSVADSVSAFLLSFLDFSALNEITSNLAVPNMLIDFYDYITLVVDIEVIAFLIRLEFIWQGFKILWALLLRIKSFVPGMGL